MKKRTTKPRLPKKPTTVQEESNAYRERFSEFVCEVEPFILKCPDLKLRIEKQIAANRYLNSRTEIHHIWGRSSTCHETNWHCAIVQVFKAHHDVGHDRRPHALEICALLAKVNRHETQAELEEIGIKPPCPSVDRLLWHLPTMNKICMRVCGNPSLRHRVEGILLPSLINSPFESMCYVVLDQIAKTEGIS